MSFRVGRHSRHIGRLLETLEPRRLLSTVPVGEGPLSVVSGDFNRDGRADVATADSEGGTVSVALGDGIGGFGATTSVAVGNYPQAVVSADFNADGRDDLAAVVSAVNDDGRVVVLLSNGDGTFAAAPYEVGPSPTAIAAADYNNDGRVDLAASDAVGEIAVLLNRGDGTFAPTAGISGQAYAVGLAAGDFNGDGSVDLASARVGSIGGVDVSFGHGDGTFATPVGYANDRHLRAILSADFDGDGDLDLATVNADNGADIESGRISILLNYGDGTFASPALLPVGRSPTALVAFDDNSDGIPDLAVTSGEDNSVLVLRGFGNGAFFPASNSFDDRGPTAVTSGDFNGDGVADLAVADGFTNAVSVSTNPNSITNSYLSVTDRTVTVSGNNVPIILRVEKGAMTFVTPAGTVRLIATSLIRLAISGAKVAVDGDLGLNGGGLFGVSVDSGAVVFNASQHLRYITASGRATMTAGGGKVLRLVDLYLAPGGTLDLNDNDLIYDYNDVSQPAAAVRSMLIAARAGGTWTGPGLTSSTAKADSTRATALGYLEAAKYKAIFGNNAAFANEAIDDTTLLVRYTLYGDTDLDRGVSINDFNALAGRFGQVGRTWADGDVDYDDGVSINDFNLLSANFGKTLAGLSPPLPSPAAVRGTASISGTAYSDTNRNGRFDKRDTRAAGKTVWLDLDGDGKLDTNEPKTLTAKDGSYAFRYLAAGQYRVRMTAAVGHKAINRPVMITLKEGQTITATALANART